MCCSVIPQQVLCILITYIPLYLHTYVDKSKMVMSPNKDMGSTDKSSAVLENVGSSDVYDTKLECETTFNNRKYNNCKTNVFNGNSCVLF